ncbi:pheromone autoinducer 2 transporter [mine drainage metagenome]|uniref:Pheromone autoinducer 2 transporter n=1 Tax=mine drainage metagenome TaxID=410659 RepID=A0A1J5QII1_9ZZZZ
MITKRDNGRSYQWLWVIAGVCLLVYLLKGILAPFLIAAILAYICNPLVDRLTHGKFGRTPATVLVLLLLIGIFALLLLIVVPLLQKEFLLMAQRLPVYFETLRERLAPWLLQHFGVVLAIDMSQLQAMLSQHWSTAGNFVGQALLVVGSHGAAVAGWLASLLLVPVVLFYLLRDWHDLVERVGHLVPRRWLGKITQIAHEVDLVLAEFLRGQLSVMLLMSAYYACALWLAGLELALPIGLIAGLLGFVPYLGISTGIVLGVLAATLQFASATAIIPILLVFGLGQTLEGMLLTPWLVGDRIGLHPVAVIFALLAGGQLFGFVGVLLALPASAAIAVGLRHARQFYLSSDSYLK